MGLLGVHNDLVVEEKQLVVVEEEVGKQAEERDMTAVLAAFPEYKSILLETQVALMTGPGALPLTHRHYIALLACSALKCPTIAKTQVAAFLGAGGDPMWLQGEAPTRLRRLVFVNNVMADTPWLLTQHHIRGLTVGPDAWTLSQAVQALTILAHFHALCTLERAEDSACSFGSKENFYGKENNVFGKENNAPRVPINPSPSSLLMVQDFCWAEEGFSVMLPFYSDLTSRLDDKFRLTGKLMAKEGDLARGVWHYVQALCGVYSDDFNYSSTQKLLQGGLQQHLEKACRGISSSNSSCNLWTNTNTWNTTPHNLDTDLHQAKISASKKAMVGLLTVEARLQSELLFALKAVMKFMT